MERPDIFATLVLAAGFAGRRRGNGGIFYYKAVSKAVLLLS